MKTKELRILTLVLAVCLVMHIATVKAQTTAPFTITHSNGGSFEFQADGKFVATGNGPWSLTSFSWNPSLGSLAAGMGSTASGYFSTASGYGTTASGNYSIALGGWTTASGHYSMATGVSTTASGNSSMASGVVTSASGAFSSASGAYAEATSMYSCVVGVLNVGGGDPHDWVPTDPLFEIGNGGDGWNGNPAINERSNALTVYKNGNMEVNGNADFQGVVTCAPGGDIPMFNPGP